MRPLMHVRRHDHYFHGHPLQSAFSLIATLVSRGCAHGFVGPLIVCGADTPVRLHEEPSPGLRVLHFTARIQPANAFMCPLRLVELPILD